MVGANNAEILVWHVPFQRDEYTAESIKAFFNLDLRQIRRYGLPEPATRLLVLLALFKIQAFLTGDLRLRTACDLDVVSCEVDRPTDFNLPTVDDLRSELPAALAACTDLFEGERGVTTVKYES